MRDFNALVFLAPPLGGKDTQCELFIKHCERISIPFLLISTGNEFRSLPSSNHTLSLMKETMDSGGLLPDFLATGIVANSLIRNFEEGMMVIWNGFPRNKKQGKEFMDMMEFYRLTPRVIYIKPCDDVLVERMNARKKIQSRSDDSLEVLKRRIEIFKKENHPMVHLLGQEYEIIEVNCTGTPEEVHSEILQKLNM